MKKQSKRPKPPQPSKDSLHHTEETFRIALETAYDPRIMFRKGIRS